MISFSTYMRMSHRNWLNYACPYKLINSRAVDENQKYQLAGYEIANSTNALDKYRDFEHALPDLHPNEFEKLFRLAFAVELPN